ncbi:MAG: hypothetical protein P8104_08190, partial [Gammaproteobacteria bacterium]
MLAVLLLIVMVMGVVCSLPIGKAGMITFPVRVVVSSRRQTADGVSPVPKLICCDVDLMEKSRSSGVKS